MCTSFMVRHLMVRHLMAHRLVVCHFMADGPSPARRGGGPVQQAPAERENDEPAHGASPLGGDRRVRRDRGRRRGLLAAGSTELRRESDSVNGVHPY